MTKEWIEKAEEFKAAERGDEKQGGQWGLQYVLRVSDDEITVDGNDAEWADVPGEVAHTGDPDDEEIRATLKAAYSETYLYLMAKIKDQTPAVNACSSVSTLWDGDCLEFYVSGDWRKRSTAGNKNWKEWDSIVHVAPREKRGLRLGLLNRAGEVEWRDITDVSLRGLETGEDYYGMEVAIPWEELKFRPAADKLIGWDWDVCYSAGSGERREFKIHWYPFRDVINQRQDWDYGRFLEDLSGGDTVRCVSLTAEDEESLEAIPAYIIKVDGSETYAAYMRAYTHEENMCFLFEVNDPDPAINTAAMAMFSGTGDYIDVVIDGRTYNIPVGIRGEDQLYSVKGGAVAKIEGTSFELNVKGRGYQVKATIPLRQIGKKKQYRFNWMVAFSDRSGGAVFRKALWREKEGALISE